MVLTAAQLQQIRQIIVDRHNAYAVTTYGVDAVSKDIVDALRAKGLLDVDVSSLEDAYIYGRVIELLGEQNAASMSYPQFKAYVKAHPASLSGPEKHAIQIASSQAGSYCQGLGNKVDKQTGALLIEADQKQRAQTMATIRQETSRAIENRAGIKNLKSALGHATKDWTRDLNRIAVTEMQDAMQRGLAQQIKEERGPKAQVFKRVAPNCCDRCQYLYLGPDGAPRIFILSELQANGSNYGRKADALQAVVGPTHPNCCLEHTKITTNRGAVNIAYIQPGDHVLTHKNRLREVTHVWCTDYEGDVLDIEVGWRTLSCTPNHPLYDGKAFRPAALFGQGERVVHNDSKLCSLSQPNYTAQDYARVVYGSTLDGPFLALILPDSAFLHEGFVYAADDMAAGPVTPGLSGRLRYGTRRLPSISGGDRLVSLDDQWIDDSLEPLVFERMTTQDAHKLRLRTVPGSFAGLQEQSADARARDFEIPCDCLNAKSNDEMLVHERSNKIRVRSRVRVARTQGRGERPADGVSVAAQQTGNAGQCHAPVVIEAGNCVGADRDAIASAGFEAPCTQNRRKPCGRCAQVGRYNVEGVSVMKMTMHDDVYVDLAEAGSVLDDAVLHHATLPYLAPVDKVTRRRFKGSVYNLTVKEDESYIADGYASHNCRCQLSSLPDGAGFDDKGRMAMGGTFGVATNPSKLEASLKHRASLRKAMLRSASSVETLGVRLKVAKWNDLDGHGAWACDGLAKGQTNTVSALLGPQPNAQDAYIVHSHGAPDYVALGYDTHQAAISAYAQRFGMAKAQSVEAVPHSDLLMFLDGPVDASSRLRFVIKARDAGQQIAVEDVDVDPDDATNIGPGPVGVNFVMRMPKQAGALPPKKRQDVGGLQAFVLQKQPLKKNPLARKPQAMNPVDANVVARKPPKLDRKIIEMLARDKSLDHASRAAAVRQNDGQPDQNRLFGNPISQFIDDQGPNA